jgi:hypothetical protein
LVFRNPSRSRQRNRRLVEGRPAETAKAPESGATLARFEHDEDMPAETLLEFARDHIEARLIDSAYADTPIPPGNPTTPPPKNALSDGKSRK